MTPTFRQFIDRVIIIGSSVKFFRDQWYTKTKMNIYKDIRRKKEDKHTGISK